jgi:hypothetical protein
VGTASKVLRDLEVVIIHYRDRLVVARRERDHDAMAHCESALRLLNSRRRRLKAELGETNGRGSRRRGWLDQDG